MRLNYINPEFFTIRFKRSPKIWTIDQIHDLWNRACERGAKRQFAISSYIGEIVKEIPKNDRGEHIVYFYSGNGSLSCYNFRYNSDFRSHAYSTSSVEFSKDKVAGRNEKLEFLLSNEKAFEMGQKFYELKKLSTYQHEKVKQILWNEVNEKLRKQFKELHPPNIFTITIGDSKYYVKTDDQHRYGYLQFHFGGVCTDLSINIK